MDLELHSVPAKNLLFDAELVMAEEQEAVEKAVVLDMGPNLEIVWEEASEAGLDTDLELLSVLL